MKFSGAQWLDILERLLWTALQVVGADAVVQFFDWDTKWIVPIAALLAGIKGLLASKFGNGTASTLPVSVEPLPAAVPPPGDHEAPAQDTPADPAAADPPPGA